MLKQVGFIGLGLIGGSLAKGIKKYQLAETIVAYNRDQTVLTQAQADGIVDVCAHEIGDAFRSCEIIFLCCPVQTNMTAYLNLLPIVNEQCILTDVGSTKKDIMDFVKEHPGKATFIGGHPMAGSEKTKYSAATSHLFENAFYILTPTPETDPDKIALLRDLVSTLKALPVVIDPEQHDFVTAAISHAPHVIAASLVNVVKELDTSEAHMHTLAAGGFKDITRIASSSAEMWQQICLTNKEYIVQVLEYFKKDIEKSIEYIKASNGEAIHDFFDHARSYRDSFQDKVPGLIPQTYALTVDVVDEPGIIARIVTLLGDHEISIKNIGIINNREYTSGVLEIVFYDKASQDQSMEVLKNMNYTVYPH